MKQWKVGISTFEHQTSPLSTKFISHFVTVIYTYIMATVFPSKDPSRFLGTEPDFIDFLYEEALRTRVVSSAGVRSAIERKWRGGKGDVIGVAGDEEDA